MKSRKIKIYRQDAKNLLDYLENTMAMDLSVFTPPVRGLIKYHRQELVKKLLSFYNDMAPLRWSETRDISIKFPQLCMLAFLLNKLQAPAELINLVPRLICNTGEDLGHAYPVDHDLQTLKIPNGSKD